jgi:hypothetical protein
MFSEQLLRCKFGGLERERVVGEEVTTEVGRTSKVILKALGDCLDGGEILTGKCKRTSLHLQRGCLEAQC